MIDVKAIEPRFIEVQQPKRKHCEKLKWEGMHIRKDSFISYEKVVFFIQAGCHLLVGQDVF